MHGFQYGALIPILTSLDTSVFDTCRYLDFRHAFVYAAAVECAVVNMSFHISPYILLFILLWDVMEDLTTPLTKA